MTTLQKIEKLNKACDWTLDIFHHQEWSIHSYGDDTPLCIEHHYPYFEAKSVKAVVNKAYKFVFNK